MKVQNPSSWAGICSWILRFLIDLATGQMDLFIIRVLSMAVHEFSHVLCGRLLLKRWPKEFRIMPWGFYLNLDIDFSGPWKKVPVYMSGPVSNLILAYFFYHLGFSIYGDMNLSLFLFNLLPVEPLDGGMIASCSGLYSRLSGRLREIATSILGTMIFLTGALNISSSLRFLIPVLSGIALLTTKSQKGDTILMNISNHITKKRKLKENRFLEIRGLGVNKDTIIEKIAEHMRCDCYNVYWVMNDNMEPVGYVNETQLLDAILSGKSHMAIGKITVREATPSNPNRHVPNRGPKSLL